MKIKIKNTIAALMAAILTAFLFTGCTLLNGDMIEVAFTLKNATDYEIEMIFYDSPPKYGSSSPHHYIIENDGESLKPGEEREFSIKLYKDQLESGNMNLSIPGMEDYSYANTVSLEDVKGFEITCGDDMKFAFTAIE